MVLLLNVSCLNNGFIYLLCFDGMSRYNSGYKNCTNTLVSAYYVKLEVVPLRKTALPLNQAFSQIQGWVHTESF